MNYEEELWKMQLRVLNTLKGTISKSNQSALILLRSPNNGEQMAAFIGGKQSDITEMMVGLLRENERFCQMLTNALNIYNNMCENDKQEKSN